MYIHMTFASSSSFAAGHEASACGFVSFTVKIQQGLELRACLEGQVDLVSSFITPITHIVTLLIPIINPLTKSP